MQIISNQSPLRLLYNKIFSFLSCNIFHYPSNKLRIIGVVGSKGKTSTVELIHYLLQNSDKKVGAISDINIHIGGTNIPRKQNQSKLNPFQIQKYLHKMIKAKCEFCILEISEQDITQNKINGIAIDSLVFMNIINNHKNNKKKFNNYLQSYKNIFKKLNYSFRKSNIQKISILNVDDEYFEEFDDFPADRKWTFSISKRANIQAQNIQINNNFLHFTADLPNYKIDTKAPLVGIHNLQNLIAALATISANGVLVTKTNELLEQYQGIPGYLQPINLNQNFSVIVDFAFHPSDVESTLKTIKSLSSKKIICVWGGKGGIKSLERQESMKLIHKNCTELILTTDDPGREDPKKIAKELKKASHRIEGNNFFEIADRYEAIRYAIFTAEKDDCVLILGRGNQNKQLINSSEFNFDDRDVAIEILKSLTV